MDFIGFENTCPIVIFFGPPKIGKTATLIRIAQYLLDSDYVIEPNRNFRNDAKYLEICDNFYEKYMMNDFAPESTSNIEFLLLDILNKNGEKTLCRLLEAPGEHYYSGNQRHNYPPYLSRIFNSKVPKIYIFFFEIGWGDRANRYMYQKAILNTIAHIRNIDSIILLCNKADLYPRYYYKGKIQHADLKKLVKNEYPAIFRRLGRKGLMKIFSPEIYNYKFLGFSSGNFTVQRGRQIYTIGPDEQAQELWKAIKKYL